jgi:hypothetical protein
VLQLVANVANTTTSDRLNESQLVTDLLQRRVPFVATVFIGHNKFRPFLLAVMPEMWDKFAGEFIGDEADDHCDG